MTFYSKFYSPCFIRYHLTINLRLLKGKILVLAGERKLVMTCHCQLESAANTHRNYQN